MIPSPGVDAMARSTTSGRLGFEMGYLLPHDCKNITKENPSNGATGKTSTPIDASGVFTTGDWEQWTTLRGPTCCSSFHDDGKGFLAAIVADHPTFLFIGRSMGKMGRDISTVTHGAF